MNITHVVPVALATTFALSACMPESRPDEPTTTQAKEIHMQELDKNDDNFLAREELDPSHRLAMEFATYDTDGDGRISEAEFFAYVEATTE